MTFDEFKDAVIADLANTPVPCNQDQLDGFKVTRYGYIFHVPTNPRAYSYEFERGWYYSHPGGQGRGATLPDAVADAQY